MCGLNLPLDSVLLTATDLAESVEYHFLVLRRSREDEALVRLVLLKARDHRLVLDRDTRWQITDVAPETPFMRLLGILENQRSGPHQISTKLLKGHVVLAGSRPTRSSSTCSSGAAYAHANAL